MAGIFGLGNYNKPGKGVEKDEKPRHPFVVFWELFWRKMRRFIGLNIIYFIIVSPILSYAYQIIYQLLTDGYDVEVEFAPFHGAMLFIFNVMPTPIHIFLLAVSCLAFGPITCGYTYMLRNAVREEHAWFSDFFIQAKKNIVQGMIIGILEIAVVFALIWNIQIVGDNAPPAFIKGLALSAIGFIFFMRNYYYMMIVTFKLSIIKIIINSLMLAILGIFRNLLVGLIIIITAALTFFVGDMLEFLLMPLFMFSFWGYTSVFICYPITKKYLLDPLEKKEQEE